MNGVLRRTLGSSLAACVLATAGSALAEAPSAHREAGLEGKRLLVTDTESSTVSVLDLTDGSLLAAFSTPGEAGSAYASPSGRYGLVVHRDENRVSVVDSGLRLEDHGDHADLVQSAPYILSTLNIGREPTHYWAHGDEIVIFNDADGTAVVLNERVFGLSLTNTTVKAAQPDHGAAVLLGDVVLVGYYDLGRVDVYSREGELLESVAGCPGLHGEATLGNVAAFGCEDGVLLVRVEGDAISSSHLAQPAESAEGARVSTVQAHDDAELFVSNFGDGLAWIDPEEQTLEVSDLPASPLRFAFGDGGEHVVVLTADGTLWVLEANTGEAQGSVPVMEAIDVSGGFGTYDAPSLALAPGVAYVGVPVLRTVVEVELDKLTLGEGALGRTFELAGVPASLAVLAVEGGTIH